MKVKIQSPIILKRESGGEKLASMVRCYLKEANKSGIDPRVFFEAVHNQYADPVKILNDILPKPVFRPRPTDRLSRKRYKTRSDWKLEDIKRLRNEGKTLQAIANIYDLSRERIRQILK